jgi:hypothetical protein
MSGLAPTREIMLHPVAIPMAKTRFRSRVLEAVYEIATAMFEVSGIDRQRCVSTTTCAPAYTAGAGG